MPSGTEHRVLIDGRSLLDDRSGGVFEYADRLTSALKRGGKFDCRVWANSWKRPANLTRFDRFTRWPNKLLHAGMVFLRRPRIDRLGGLRPDLFWAPNLHFIAVSRGLPFVQTIHDLSFERYPEFFSPKQRLWHAAVNPRGLCRRADAILAVSEHTKRDLVQLYGLAPDKITVTHHGVAEEFFSPPAAETLAEARRRLNLPERFILHLGALEPRKNHLSLIDAFESLKSLAANSDLGLVLAGPDGWNAAWVRRVERRIAASPCRESIRRLGFVSGPDRRALYRLAAALAFPSYYEGFGLPPLEAMASGTPVVASFASSLGEVVGDAGVLTDPYRPAEMAEALRSVLESPALAGTLSTRGRERARRFTWEACASKTAETFLRLLG